MAKPANRGQRGKSQQRRPTGPARQQGKGKAKTPAGSRPATSTSNTADILDRFLYYMLHVMVFVVPVTFAQISYDQFDIVKVVIVRALTLVMIALWLWRFLLVKEGSLRRSPIDWLILAFLAWVFVSSLVSIHPPTAFFGKYRRYEGFISILDYAVLFFLTTQVVTNITRVKSLVRTALVAAGIISLYGVLQALGWDFLSWGAHLPFDTLRAFSSFGNPDLLAGYVSLMLPIGLMAFITQESGPQDEFLAIGLALIVGLSAAIGFAALHLGWPPIVLQLARAIFGLAAAVGLALPWVLRFIDPRQREGHFVTLFAVSSLTVGLAALGAFSRSAWVAAAVSLILIPIMLWRHGMLFNRKVLTLAVVIVVAVAAVGIATARSSSTVINLPDRIASIFRFDQGSAAGRISIWRSAWAAAKARPVFGFGPDTFRLVFPKYKEVGYVQLVGRLSVADNVHNYPLQLASTLGIPGALLFYAVALGGMFFGWKAAWGKRDRSPDRAFMGGLVVALVAYQTHLFFGISITGSTFLEWIVMAMAVLPLARTVTVKWRPSTETLRTIGVGAAVVIAAALLVFDLQYFRADQYYLTSFQYQGYNIDESISAARKAIALDPYNDMYWGQLGYLLSIRAMNTQTQPDGLAAVNGIKTAIRFNPYEFDNYVFLANTYALLASHNPAYWPYVSNAASQALAVEPVAPAARYYKGLAALSTNRLQEAVTQLSAGAFEDPNYARIFVALGQAYERLGQKSKALATYLAGAKASDSNDPSGSADSSQAAARLRSTMASGT